MSKPLVVLDTNVLVSALLSKTGNPAKILNKFLEGELTLVYSEEILKEYKEWWDEQKVLHGDLWENADRLFLQECGKPINPCTPRNWLARFQLENGLFHASPHSFRNTSATLQLLAGGGIKSVSERLGHADEHITLRLYNQISKDEDRQTAQKFNDFLAI